MNGLRWVLSLSMVLLMGCNMSGCGRGIFNTEPFVDAKKDAQGNSVLLDTPRMWRDFTANVDDDIRREAAGERAPRWVDLERALVAFHSSHGEGNARKCTQVHRLHH